MPPEDKSFGVWAAVILAIIILGFAFFFSSGRLNDLSDTPQATTTTPVASSNPVVGYQDELASATSTPVLYDAQGNILTINYVNELASTTNTTYYSCAGGREFKAKVEVKSQAPGKAEVFLKDGSKMLLTQTVSASGVRYANSGESFVFWTKGDTAFIQEGSVASYADCVAK